MNLSDAILKGCEMIPEQSYGEWFGYNKHYSYIHDSCIYDDDVITSACVLGAAFIGVTGSRTRRDVSDGMEHRKQNLLFFQKTLVSVITHHLPCTCKRVVTGFDDTVYQYCMHLNDTHHWTREQIAEWIKTLEMEGVI